MPPSSHREAESETALLPQSIHMVEDVAASNSLGDKPNEPAVPLTQPEESMFFRLPRELRNEIYAYALYSDALTGRYRVHTLGSMWIDLRDNLQPDHRDDLEDDLADEPTNKLLYRPPPLLAVSRQIRHEAAEWYYSKIPFLFDEPETYLMWLKSLDDEARKRMRVLACCHCDDYDQDEFDFSADVGSVECWRKLSGYFKIEGVEVSGKLQVCGGYCLAHTWLSGADIAKTAETVETAGTTAEELYPGHFGVP